MPSIRDRLRNGFFENIDDDDEFEFPTAAANGTDTERMAARGSRSRNGSIFNFQEEKEFNIANVADFDTIAHRRTSPKKNMPTATSTTTATTATATPTTKRTSPFQTGLDKMKEPNALQAATTSLHTLANVVDKNADDAFDLLYVNMPWKTIDMASAAQLPLPTLVQGKDHAGLLLWVDGPCVDKAVRLLDTWGFAFHSILHSTSYGGIDTTTNAIVPETTTTTTTIPVVATDEKAADAADAADPSPETTPLDPQNPTTNPTPKPNPIPTPKKPVVPHGWVVDGLVPSRSRQLWFAVRGAKATDHDKTAPYLKDVSFIRKRLQATSTFEYTKMTDAAYAPLSSKRKNLDTWVVFPEYHAYVPRDVEAALETIQRPATRVLSLFSDAVSKSWYTWGPNVPGYVSSPTRGESRYPLVHALLKYFSAMKGTTLQKYLNLVNLYAVQYAKDLGHSDSGEDDDNDKQYLTPLVEGRMQDFMTDVLRKYHETGGVQQDAVTQASTLPLDGLEQFAKLPPVTQMQVLLTVGQVIHIVLRKNAEATERRKRAIKRKREAMEEGGGGEEEPRPRVPRKYGIAAPVNISDDLASFMGLASGEQVARTTVVKYVNEYITSHNLQNPARRSEILCDDVLRNLLKPADNFTVNYFNLCRLLGPHFLKPAAPGKQKPPTPTPSPNPSTPPPVTA